MDSQNFEDDAFQILLNRFTDYYSASWVTYEQRMIDVVNSVSDANGGLRGHGINHPAITSRRKSHSSAVQSIKRRQKERIERRLLKQLVEQRGASWKEYCERWDELDKMNETEPFGSLEDILSVVADLAGIRISFYLPGDVLKAKEFLEERTKTLIHVRTKHKTDRDPRIPNLSSRIEAEQRNQERDRGDKSIDCKDDGAVLDPPKLRTVFPGYSAYHVTVKVSEDRIPNEAGFSKPPGADMLVEVQIATAVMHAWQGIEHDIVYKNLGTVPPSDDQLRLIDLFNGIIHSGQLVLEQLEATTKNQAMTRITRGEPVQHTWQLEAIMAKHYQRNKHLGGTDVSRGQLNQLLQVLQATGLQTAGHVHGLLEKVSKDTSDSDIPFRMLESLCASQEQRISTSLDHNVGGVWANARIKALRLVHMLNMAIHLNVARLLIVSLTNKRDYPRPEDRPTPADFLGLLHLLVTQSDVYKAERMNTFCKWVFDTVPSITLDNYELNARLRFARELPEKCLVACPQMMFTSSEEMDLQNGIVVISTWIIALLCCSPLESAVAQRKKTENILKYLVSSTSSIIEQQQQFFLPTKDYVQESERDENIKVIRGKWIVDQGGTTLSPWNIRKVNFTNPYPGFKPHVIISAIYRSYQAELAAVTNLETFSVHALGLQVRRSVLGEESDIPERLGGLSGLGGRFLIGLKSA